MAASSAHPSPDPESLSFGVPDGVLLIDLPTFDDDRGSLSEVFRPGQHAGPAPVQWNMVRSRAGVLRGVHAHYHHADHLVVVHGLMRLGLADLRAGSATEGCRAMVELRGSTPQAAVIPEGVAHGFYFPEPSIHVYGLTQPWSVDHHLGCRWDDPDLGLDFGCDEPLLSAIDRGAGPLSRLVVDVNAGLAARG